MNERAINSKILSIEMIAFCHLPAMAMAVQRKHFANLKVSYLFDEKCKRELLNGDYRLRNKRTLSYGGKVVQWIFCVSFSEMSHLATLSELWSLA